MASTQTAAPAALHQDHERSWPPPLTGPVLVAADGSEAAVPALEMARLLARGEHLVEVLAVVEPAPTAAPPIEVPLYLPEADVARRDAMLPALREEARRVLGDHVKVHADAVIGRPVEEIARRARDVHAAMIVTGVRHHGRADRLLFRGDTPLGIARLARRPVLVVPAHVTHLPRVVLIATDLDQTSVNAARAARPLLPRAERVYVVHVQRLAMAPADPSWEHVQARIATDNFTRIVEALDLPAGVKVDTRTLTGHPVEELVAFAEAIGADLIVAGYRKRLLIDRLTGPRSIAERVFRGTPCTMLLVPETAPPSWSDDMTNQAELGADREAWATALADFTRRNAGRAANLEIDTREMGAQAQVVRFPLVGVDYERSTDTLHFMFGDEARGLAHLAHSVPHPESVQLQQGGDRDQALRVAHRGGYTLLTLADDDRPAGK